MAEILEEDPGLPLKPLGYGGGRDRARPVVVEGGAGVSRAGQESAGRARRGIALDRGDALLDGSDGDVCLT